MTDLLLETATEVCSVAIAVAGTVIAEVTATEDYQHASHLTLFIEQALRQANLSVSDLDRIVLSDGPGSYTSLRVGAATAKGLCTALPGLAFTAVSTLAALACAAGPEKGEDMVMATINSRRGEVYGQVFSQTDLAPLTEIMNVQLTEADWRGKLLNGRGLGHILVCGPGQKRVRDAVPPEDNAFTFGPPYYCAAHNLLQSTCELRTCELRTCDPAVYEPLYLNPPFVTKSKKKPLL